MVDDEATFRASLLFLRLMIPSFFPQLFPLFHVVVPSPPPAPASKAGFFFFDILTGDSAEDEAEEKEVEEEV